jgi:hypothetical protein
MAGPFIGICFREVAGVGWTSVYGLNKADVSSSLQALDLVNTAEMQLLPSAVECNRIKVSDITVKGDVAFQFPTTPAGNFTGATGSVPAEPNWSFPVQFLCGATNRFKKFLRGLPSEFVTPGVPSGFKFTTQWGAELVAYANAVQANCVLISRPGKFNNGQLIIVPITGFIDPPANSNTTQLRIRRAGRPFDLHRGRRMVG